MCHGLTSARHARDGWIVARVVLCLLALVALMADPLDAVEEIHLPLPPPVSGALVAGPFNYQFTGEDAIRLTVVNSLAGVRVRVAYRTAPKPTTTQTNEMEIAPTSDRVASTVEVPVGGGYLLNLAVFASAGAPSLGHTFAMVDVIRGSGASARVLGRILADYITQNQAVAWPGSPIRGSLEGRGLARVITGTDPAAGVEMNETVPMGARWHIISLRTGFSTSAAAGNRQSSLQFLSGGNALYQAPQFATIGPSAGPALSWGQNMSYAVAPSAQLLIAGIPADLVLRSGDVFRSVTAAIDVGDNYNAPIYSVREWLEVD